VRTNPIRFYYTAAGASSWAANSGPEENLALELGKALVGRFIAGKLECFPGRQGAMLFFRHSFRLCVQGNVKGNVVPLYRRACDLLLFPRGKKAEYFVPYGLGAYLENR